MCAKQLSWWELKCVSWILLRLTTKILWKYKQQPINHYRIESNKQSYCWFHIFTIGVHFYVFQIFLFSLFFVCKNCLMKLELRKWNTRINDKFRINFSMLSSSARHKVQNRKLTKWKHMQSGKGTNEGERETGWKKKQTGAHPQS